MGPRIRGDDKSPAPSLRAQAKQSIGSAANERRGLLRRFRLRWLSYGGQVAPRNDENMHPHSRGAMRPSFALKFPPSPIRGRRECRAPDAPDNRVCLGRKQTHTRSSGHTGITRHSPRNGFNGFLRALPGDRAFLPPSPTEVAFRELDASVGASGPHDFSVRKKAPSSEAPLTSTASRPALMTLRNAPLSGRDDGINKAASSKRRSEIFLRKGLDRVRAKQPDGQISWLSALSYPSPLWGGWHIVSAANDVTGGGLPPRRIHSRTTVRYPHPTRCSLRSQRATLPTRGRDKERAASLNFHSAERAAARSPETPAAPRTARHAPPAPDSARRETAPDAPRR